MVKFKVNLDQEFNNQYHYENHYHNFNCLRNLNYYLDFCRFLNFQIYYHNYLFDIHDKDHDVLEYNDQNEVFYYFYVFNG